MRSSVAGKNQVSIPAKLARSHGIRPGCQLEWTETSDPEVLTVRVIPDRRTLEERVRGAGRKYLKPGDDPIGDLVRERDAEDSE